MKIFITACKSPPYFLTCKVASIDRPAFSAHASFLNQLDVHEGIAQSFGTYSFGVRIEYMIRMKQSQERNIQKRRDHNNQFFQQKYEIYTKYLAVKTDPSYMGSSLFNNRKPSFNRPLICFSQRSSMGSSNCFSRYSSGLIIGNP